MNKLTGELVKGNVSAHMGRCGDVFLRLQSLLIYTSPLELGPRVIT